MITKNDLRRYRDSRELIHLLEEELSELRSRLYGINSGSLSDMPRTIGNNNDRWTAIIDRMNRRRQTLTDEINSINELENAIEQAIMTLPPNEAAVIIAYYFRCMTWAQVADKLHYDERQIYRLHGEALRKLAAM